MAISQTKYIEIASKIANSPIGNRDLSGLLFTSGNMVDGANASIKASYDAGDIVALTDSGVKTMFGVSSDEYKFATKYFSYISPSGKTPRTLYIAKILSAESPSEAFTRITNKTDNFGSFTFMPSDSYAVSALKNIFATNTDNKYLAVCGVEATIEDGKYIFDDVIDAATTLGEIKGTHLVVGADKYCAAIPMAILASVNYNTGVNSVVNYMFRQVNGEIPVVTNYEDYDTLTSKNINFYGQTQANGRSIAFYQKGVNLDGTDTGVYCNEMWLKSAIVESFLNFLVDVVRIPANYAGAGMCRNAIMGDVTQALANGTIMIGKALTSDQKAKIFQYSNDELAWKAVQNDGYWLDVVIVADGNDYKTVYRLVYSKGDSIRFVDGTHYLV